MPLWLRTSVLCAAGNSRNPRPAFYDRHGGVWHCARVDFYRCDGTVYPTLGVEQIPWKDVDARSRAEIMLSCVCPD
jgi:hypothetical protein